MGRLDTERQKRLEPVRMAHAVQQLKQRGYEIIQQDERQLQFLHRGKTVTFYPYSGWATGATITDGRGLNKLLKQLDDEKL